MDVVVTPVGDTLTSWSVTDGLDRSLGSVHHSAAFYPFTIEPDPASRLLGVHPLHTSLVEAMCAIAGRVGGTCVLRSQDED